MSSMPRACRYRASTGVPRPIGSIPSCSSAPFSAGCAVSGTTARWPPFRPLQRKMPDAPTASATPSLASTPPSSTASRPPSRDWASATSTRRSRRRPSAWNEGEPIPPNTLCELKRDFARKQFVAEQIQQIEKARLEQLKQAPKTRPNLMVLVLMRVIGIGIETADMLVKEILSRNLRDRRAVARYGGLTGSPDESGKTRREKGLARAGNARVRRGMIQLAWRFLEYQKESSLAKWFRARTENAPRLRKKMIVALARKLLIVLWRFVRHGMLPEGVVLRPAH